MLSDSSSLETENITTLSDYTSSGKIPNFFSVDVEDWFNILDTDKAPKIGEWGEQPYYFQKSLESILDMLQETGVRATFFWLGWFAERFPELVLRCQREGHEIASHGYGHLLAYEVGREAFREDIRKSKAILESIIGEEVLGFRAAGFSTLDDTTWTFEEIHEAGFVYDSSIFPSSRGHGGMAQSSLDPHLIKTPSGALIEFPQSLIEIFGRRLSLFGGGYLRLTPLLVLKKGIQRLQKNQRPLIVYIHPREVCPEHPRLPLSWSRYFKCYVNLKSTMKKLTWLAKNCDFITFADFVTAYQSK